MNRFTPWGEIVVILGLVPGEIKTIEAPTSTSATSAPHTYTTKLADLFCDLGIG